MLLAFKEVIGFIAHEIPAEKLRAFRPSEAAQGRVRELLSRQKDETITPDEVSELDQYLVLEHIMRMAKASA
jgi:hypothetical protein